MKSTIDKLIVNSSYEEPAYFWSYDPGIFKEIPLAPEAEKVGIQRPIRSTGDMRTWAISKDPAYVSWIIRGIEKNL